jgi:hypothetical protein
MEAGEAVTLLGILIVCVIVLVVIAIARRV